MNIERNKPLLLLILNKQFEMIDESFRLFDLDKLMTPNKKGKQVYYYDLMEFADEDQYSDWRIWMQGTLLSSGYIDNMKEADYIDLRYGLIFHIT